VKFTPACMCSLNTAYVSNAPALAHAAAHTVCTSTPCPLLSYSSLLFSVRLLLDCVAIDFPSIRYPCCPPLFPSFISPLLTVSDPPLPPFPLSPLPEFEPFADEVLDLIRNKKETPHGRVCMMEFVAVAVSDVRTLAVHSNAMR
jgi:hypothetical protein